MPKLTEPRTRNLNLSENTMPRLYTPCPLSLNTEIQLPEEAHLPRIAKSTTIKIH